MPEAKARTSPLAVTLCDHAGVCDPVPVLWALQGRGPGYHRSASTRGHTKILMNCKLWLPLGYLRPFVPNDQQARGGVTTA